MMNAVQLHARAEDGRILIDLPREHLALANAEFLVLLVPDAAAVLSSAPVAFRPTDWDAPQRAYEVFEGHDLYPTITDPVAWQRELRGEWDRDETARP